MLNRRSKTQRQNTVWYYLYDILKRQKTMIENKFSESEGDHKEKWGNYFVIWNCCIS